MNNTTENDVNTNKVYTRPEIIVQGNWSGEVIWRHKTAAEVLLEQLNINIEKRKQENKLIK